MESRILQLIAALRASGVRVSLAESAEAFSAVDLMGIQHREHFRLSLRTTLIKDVRDLPVFDKLFPLFFGTGDQPMMGGNPTDDMTPEEAQMLADALREFAQSLRQRMQRLMNGEQLSKEELEQLGQMVGLNQMDDLRYQEWMAQRMMRALAFPEVREALRELMEQLQQRNGKACITLKILYIFTTLQMDGFKIVIQLHLLRLVLAVLENKIIHVIWRRMVKISGV